MLKIDNHICTCKSCEMGTNKNTIVARGKKTEFIMKNKSRKLVWKYIVDECLLISKRNEEKCDFLFDIREEKIAYFIECKGSDVLKAVKQIDSTVSILRLSFTDYILKGRIISTKVYSPDIRTSQYIKLREKLNGNLETKNITLTETI